MATKKPSRSYYDIKLSESKELKRFQKLAGIKPSRLLNEQVTLGQSGVYEPEEDPIESFEFEGVPESALEITDVHAPAQLDLDPEAMASAERLTTSGNVPGITDVQPAEIDDSVITPEEAEGVSEEDAAAREAQRRSQVTNTRETYVDVVDTRLAAGASSSLHRPEIEHEHTTSTPHGTVRSPIGRRGMTAGRHVGEDRDVLSPEDIMDHHGVEAGTERYKGHYDEWREEEVSRLVEEHKQATGYPPQGEAWISDEDYLSQFGDQIEGVPPAEYVYDPDDVEMNAEGGILHRRASRIRAPANMEIISVCPGLEGSFDLGDFSRGHAVAQADPRCRGSVSTSGNRVIGRFYDEEDQTWYHVAFNHLPELPDVEVGDVIAAGGYIGNEVQARISDTRGSAAAGERAPAWVNDEGERYYLGDMTGYGSGPHLHMGMWIPEGNLEYDPDAPQNEQVPSEYLIAADLTFKQGTLEDGSPDPNSIENPNRPGQYMDRRLRSFTNFLLGKQLSTETYADPGLAAVYTGGANDDSAQDFRTWINENHPDIASNYCPEGMECTRTGPRAAGIGANGGANTFTESALDHQVPIEQDDGTVVMTALGDLYMQERLQDAEGSEDTHWKRHADGTWFYLASDGRYYRGGPRADSYMAAAHPERGIEPPTTAMMDAEEAQGGAQEIDGAPADLAPEEQDAVADAAQQMGLTRESLSLGSKKDLLLEKRQVVRFQQLAGIKPSRILAEQISFDQAGVKLPEKKPIEPVKPAEPVEPAEPVDDTGEVFEFDVESDLTEFDPLNPIDPDKFQYDYDDEWEDFDRGSTAIEPPEIQAEPIEVSPDAWKTEAHDFDATAGFTTAGQITRAEALTSVYDGSGTKKEQHSEADDFRQWVNTSHPSIASALKLDKAGPSRGSNNVTAQNAFGHIFDHDGDASTPEVTLGDLYRQEVLGTTAQAGDAELVKAYRGANTELRDFLDAGQKSPGTRFSLKSITSPWRNRHTLDISQLSIDSGMNEAVIYAIAGSEGKIEDLAFECSQVLGHATCATDYKGYKLGDGKERITRTEDIEMLRKAIRDNPTRAGDIVGRTSFGFGQVLGESGAMNAYAKSLGHTDWAAAVKDAATKGKTEKDVALDMVDWFEKTPGAAGTAAFIEFTTVKKPRAVKAGNKAAQTDKAEDWYNLAAAYNGNFWTRSDVLNLMTHKVDTGRVDAKGNAIMERQWDPAKFKGGVVPTVAVSGYEIRKLHGRGFAGMQAFEKTLTAAALKDYRRKRYDTKAQRKFKEGTGTGAAISRVIDPAALSISESDFRTAYWEAKRTNPSVTSQQVLDGLIAAHYGGATPKRDDEVYRESKLRKAIKSAILKEKVRSAILKELTGGPSMPGGLLYPIPPQVRQDYDKHVHQKLLDRAHSDRESRMDDMVGRQSVSPGYSEEAMLSQAQYDKDYSDVHSGASDSAFAQSDVDEYELDPSIESDAGLPGDAVASLAPALKSAGRTYSTPEEYRYFRSRTATPMEEGIKIKVVRKWSEEPCELPTIDEQVDATDITRRLQGRSSGTRTGEEGGMTRADWQDSGDARTPRREFAEPEMTEDGFLIYNSDVGENPRIVYVFPGVVKGGVNRARDMTADRVKANLSAYPNTIVVVAPTHKTSWESLRSVGETALGGRTPSSKRLVGHSGGARGVKDALRSGDEFDKITYADPEAAHLMGRDFDHSRSTMHYNPENWSEKLGAHTTDLAGEMGEDRAHLSDRLEDEGGWEHHWRIFDDALSDSMFDEEDERATQYLRRPELEPVVYQTTGPTLPPTETLHEDASDEDLPYYVAAPSTNDGREVIDQVTKAGPTGFDIASRFAPPKVRAAKTAFDFGYGTGTAINKAMGGIDADASDIDWGYAGTQAKGLASDAWKGVKGAFKLQEAYTQNVYEIECSIRIDKKKGGDKEETLTDIRGIPGVTIVGVVPGSSKESSNYFISTLLLKFEQNNNIPPRNYIKRTLTPGLRKIPGVGNFKVKRVKHISKAAD